MMAAFHSKVNEPVPHPRCPPSPLVGEVTKIAILASAKSQILLVRGWTAEFNNYPLTCNFQPLAEAKMLKLASSPTRGEEPARDPRRIPSPSLLRHPRA